MIWTKRIGATLVFLGIALYLAGYALVYRENWIPVSMPLRLKAGNHAEASFRPAFSDRYYIYLTVQKGDDWTRTKCLLGAEIVPEVCKDTSSIVDVSWTASSKAGLLARGDSHEWLGTRGGLSRLIGLFEAPKSVSCTFSITVNRDGYELNALNPRVTVEPNGLILEDYLLKAALLKFAGGACVVLGLVLTMPGFLKILRGSSSKQPTT